MHWFWRALIAVAAGIGTGTVWYWTILATFLRAVVNSALAPFQGTPVVYVAGIALSLRLRLLPPRPSTRSSRATVAPCCLTAKRAVASATTSFAA